MTENNMQDICAAYLIKRVIDNSEELHKIYSDQLAQKRGAWIDYVKILQKRIKILEQENKSLQAGIKERDGIIHNARMILEGEW